MPMIIDNATAVHTTMTHIESMFDDIEMQLADLDTNEDDIELFKELLRDIKDHAYKSGKSKGCCCGETEEAWRLCPEHK